MRLGAAFITCLIMLVFTLRGAHAAEVEVDAELILVVDVSRSMTARELEIQRRGYAEALTSPEVISAITGGMIGRVALLYFEWSGSRSHRIIVDWSLISRRQDAAQFANKLTAYFDPALRRTSISGALRFAARQFDGNGFVSNRRIIDVSGDGPNNDGQPVLWARQKTLAQGIIINGLPLMTREGMGNRFHLKDLDQYYLNCVIGGPGSFVLPVLDWRQFPSAVRQKLVLELAMPAPPRTSGPLFVQLRDSNYDCLIGEKIWQDFIESWSSP